MRTYGLDGDQIAEAVDRDTQELRRQLERERTRSEVLRRRCEALEASVRRAYSFAAAGRQQPRQGDTRGEATK